MLIMNRPFISPKSFLKARRPERFSDSVFKEVAQLDRSLLEHHLLSTTSRNQENDFANFAHKLCQRTICPNLLPQTGPMGGGDSKVDSETYPISDDLALIWHGCWDSKASKERWAFAFSAKADWLSKVKSDVEKIAKTQREYTKAYFVTNQYVKDQKKAKIQDELSNKHGLDVRILDLKWILDEIFKGNHEDLAIKELGLTGLSKRIEKKGPLDVQREDELKEIEKRIHESTQTGQFDLAFVEDSIEAAEIIRSIERPRVEIEGGYGRANRLASKFGTPRQKAECVYQWAWTLYWWFEDFDSFVTQYGEVEKQILGSQNVYDFEQLSNLWQLLHGAIRNGKINKEDSSYQKRTDVLLSELDRLKMEVDRPSTALQAETLFLVMQLSIKFSKGEALENVLVELRDVVLRSKGLVGYPLEPLVNILSEIDHVIETVPGYNELFETILSVVSTRDGEVRAGRLLLKRGINQFSKGHYIFAISTLGKALGHLHKHETRHEIVKALFYCGCAYDEVGLPWAAKGTLLAGANIATNELWQYGEVTPFQATCFRRIKRVELRLGRLPHILAWHELDSTVRQVLSKYGDKYKGISVDDRTFEYLLIRLFLRTEFIDLNVQFPHQPMAIEPELGWNVESCPHRSPQPYERSLRRKHAYPMIPRFRHVQVSGCTVRPKCNTLRPDHLPI